MRLTPSWFQSSADAPGEERSGDSTSASGVTIYYPPQTDHVESNEADARRVNEYLPESDTVLLSTLDEMNMPVTVDEVTDTLIEPRRASIETWAAVHKRLHEDRLPALDASQAIDFDETQGIVDRDSARSNTTRLLFPALLAIASISVLLTVMVFVSGPALFAVTVSLLTTASAIWFVPGYV
ncbi:hypothetical protein [Natrinema halophilum]|uniref:hypothetical protein n=1 Tax=Natrinema halophilum TaxID=1699371 RepID=UPI001F4688DB|nr:hypothetical protein [Natrinema halophilum]UHQ96014.1 hypothetical protein HYG82_21295 [Natrinema halophilum]